MESGVSAHAPDGASASKLQAGARAAGTRALLGCGVVAGPFYLAVGLAQALVREGFDLGRHPLSLLANGPGGWVQTLNFLVTGALVVAAAVGLARVLGGRSGRAAGWILGLFGASMVAAAIFPADPVDGFPPGTPEGFPTAISTPGLLHFAAGGLGFLALAAGCVTAGLALRRRGEAGAGMASVVAGLVVGLGFFGPMMGIVPGGILGIWAAVVVGFGWLSLTSAHLRRSLSSRAG